jgi:hypothetical protein
MIRDPSDGSVRGKLVETKRPLETATNAVGAVLQTGTSGLQTGSTKPEYQARLEKAREWIRDYRAGKFKTAIADGESE